MRSLGARMAMRPPVRVLNRNMTRNLQTEGARRATELRLPPRSLGVPSRAAISADAAVVAGVALKVETADGLLPEIGVLEIELLEIGVRTGVRAARIRGTLTLEAVTLEVLILGAASLGVASLDTKPAAETKPEAIAPDVTTRAAGRDRVFSGRHQRADQAAITITDHLLAISRSFFRANRSRSISGRRRTRLPLRLKQQPSRRLTSRLRRVFPTTNPFLQRQLLSRYTRNMIPLLRLRFTKNHRQTKERVRQL